MSKYRDCPCENESPNPCPKCGATVSGKDAVNGVCQAGATWDRATAAERERCAKIAEAHKGSYTKRPSYKVIWKTANEESRIEIRAEERGEDIAAEIIARAIRAEVSSSKD